MSRTLPWSLAAVVLGSLAPSLSPSDARADELMLVGEQAARDLHSPQRWAFELKFGPYSPDIDSTPGLTGHPFSDLFLSQYSPDVGKRPPGRLLTTLELDFQLWHGFGSLGVAGSVGIARRSTHSFNYTSMQPGAVCMVPHCVRSSDTTTLSVMPLALELVYRFDVLAVRYKFPLVPYLKGGLAYDFWWVENGSGGLSSSLNKNSDGSTDNAIGGTFGLVAHPGIAVLLDVFDPSAAQTMDNEIGINHSYLFVELNYAWITGFGSSTKMTLSDVTWNAGVAFEF